MRVAIVGEHRRKRRSIEEAILTGKMEVKVKGSVGSRPLLSSQNVGIQNWNVLLTQHCGVIVGVGDSPSKRPDSCQTPASRQHHATRHRPAIPLMFLLPCRSIWHHLPAGLSHHPAQSYAGSKNCGSEQGKCCGRCGSAKVSCHISSDAKSGKQELFIVHQEVVETTVIIVE